MGVPSGTQGTVEPGLECQGLGLLTFLTEAPDNVEKTGDLRSEAGNRLWNPFQAHDFRARPSILPAHWISTGFLNRVSDVRVLPRALLGIQRRADPSAGYLAMLALRGLARRVPAATGIP
jgi:hypothetical protein